MKRIALFLATNLAIMLVLSATVRLPGIEPYLNAQGLNLGSLLVFAVVMGFGGSFLSLALSKWTPNRAMGVQVIETPVNPTALRCLASLHPQPLPDKMAAFGLAGGAPQSWKRLFLTHRPLAERIAALQSIGAR